MMSVHLRNYRAEQPFWIAKGAQAGHQILRTRRMSGYSDPYRQFPLRVIGYSNAMVRPLKELIPKPVYQLSLGVMHTFFLTNSYDYASKIDAKNQLSSAIDCYTWHCAASWVGPAMVIDGTMKLVKKYTHSRTLPIAAAYVAFAAASPLMDRAMDWYFYGFWSAGNKERPRLQL